MKQIFFCNSLAFSMIQWMLPIWSLISLAFLNPAYTSGSSLFRCRCSLAWRILSINLRAREICTIVWWVTHALALPFFGIRMKTDLFQSFGYCWVFQICCHIECTNFIESSFRIWNSSAEIPSPPLALFVVIFPKAHLTSHSRIYGSRWATTPSWLSRSLRPFFVQFFCVFLPPFLNLFCFC